MRRFCVDIPATKAALLLNMNRNTTTRFFRLFREAICYHREKEFKKFVGEIERDMEFVGGANDGNSALKRIGKTKPDVVIMDVQLEEEFGFDFVKQITLYGKTKVIALSGYDSPSYVRKMLRFSAKGYILKAGKPDTLLSSIRILAKGGTFLDPKLKHDYNYYMSEPDKSEELTSRPLKTAFL